MLSHWKQLPPYERRRYLSLIAGDVIRKRLHIRTTKQIGASVDKRLLQEERNLRQFLYSMLELEDKEKLDYWAKDNSPDTELRICIKQMREEYETYE